MAGWVGRCPARPQRGLGGSVGLLGKIRSGFPICLLNGWLKVKDVIPTNGRDGCVSNKRRDLTNKQLENSSTEKICGDFGTKTY